MAKTIIVGCGGFGINRLAQVKRINGEENLLANVQYLAMDGSDSNLPGSDLGDDEVWLCSDVDGAGQDRAAGAAAYLKWLQSEGGNIPKADLYVLVYSTHGGSGSVIGPELHRILLARGERVISCTLAQADTLASAKNTINVLNGVANLAKRQERPMVMSVETGAEMTATQVDNQVCENVVNAARILANKHHGLDTADVYSFLDYTNRGVPPQLTMLERFSSAQSINAHQGKMMTTLSLVKDQDADRAACGGLMNTYGIIGDRMDEVFFGLTIEGMDSAHKALQETYTEQQRIADSFKVDTAWGNGADVGMEY